MKDLLQKLLILRSPGIGAVKYKKLLTEYGDVYSAVDSLHLSDDFIDSVKSEISKALTGGKLNKSTWGAKYSDMKNELDILKARRDSIKKENYQGPNALDEYERDYLIFQSSQSFQLSTSMCIV